MCRPQAVLGQFAVHDDTLDGFRVQSLATNGTSSWKPLCASMAHAMGFFIPRITAVPLQGFQA